MTMGEAEALGGRGRPDGWHAMVLMPAGRSLIPPSRAARFSGSSCGEAGVRVKTVPPTATARLRSILRVSQKVDTSIGPLLNGQTEDIPRSSRLTTYPGWARGPMTCLRPILGDCSRSDGARLASGRVGVNHKIWDAEIMMDGQGVRVGSLPYKTEIVGVLGGGGRVVHIEFVDGPIPPPSFATARRA